MEKENSEKNITYNFNYCQATKKNGKPCRQCGKPNQMGGPIIDGYCNFHKYLRETHPFYNKVELTTMN